MKFNLIPTVLLILSLLGCQQKAPELTPAEAQQIAKDVSAEEFKELIKTKTWQ